MIQPNWTTQLSHALECYNVTTKEEDEDPRKINLRETKGNCEVEGPQLDNPYITEMLKTRKLNIGTEEELKFANNLELGTTGMTRQ